MELNKPYYRHQEVRLAGSKIVIPNVYALQRLGGGTDGLVYKYNDDIVVKILKHDVEERKIKKLMTFQKANYFCENLKLKRIAVPIDMALDSDGIYNGYAMKFLDDLSKMDKNSPNYKSSGEFTCGNLIYAANELRDDFNQLTKAKVVAKDINEGSYIFTPNFIYLCDTDKYYLVEKPPKDENLKMYNYTISKLLTYVMKKLPEYKKEDKKTLENWVKRCANSGDYLQELSREIGSDYKTPISEFAKYKMKKIIK